MEIRLQCTCEACPEQYDALDSTGERVGYLRLRHGYFSVRVPDPSGAEIYGSYAQGDGMFTDDEREPYLLAAVAALRLWYATHERRY